MQTGIQSSSFLGVESRQAYCAGYREELSRSFDPVDHISIQGYSDNTNSKNPQFLAILEERVVSYLV